MTQDEFNLDDFVDAATGRPASEVIGDPGHYHLKPAENAEPDQGDARDQLYPPVEENFWDDRTTTDEGDKPPASDMLRGLMTQKHDPTRQSVTIPVKELMAVIVEIGNIERKAQANGQLCMEKTRELVILRAQLSACESSREEKVDIISRVWTLLENESPLGEDLSAKDVRAALRGEPEVNAQSVLGQDVEDPDQIGRASCRERV